MNTVLILVTIQGLLGAFDTLYHHEYTEKLPWKESARKELMIHGIRNFFYFVIFISLGWVEWHGIYAYIFGAIFCFELYLTLWDFVVEDQTRKLPATERITHTILTLNYGLVLATFAPILYEWSFTETAFVGVNHGILSWIATLYALGVLVWTMRDLLSAFRVKKRDLPTMNLKKAGQRFLITGGSGFIGQKISQILINAGHDVTILSRNHEKTAGQLKGNFRLVSSLKEVTQHFDVIINLAGESISTKRWSQKRKEALFESRLSVTKQINEYIDRINEKPALLISGSAVGIYGMSDESVFTEQSTAEKECFSRDLCLAWENEALKAKDKGVRVVLVRTGMVLGFDGGALPEMLVPFDLFAGGKFGTGQQWVSWIHIDDFIGLVAHIINHEMIDGPMNATAPTPVRNEELTKTLAKVMKRPAILAIPAFNLELLLGEMATEILLDGQKVLPEKALESGYQFTYATLEPALQNIMGN